MSTTNNVPMRTYDLIRYAKHSDQVMAISDDDKAVIRSLVEQLEADYNASQPVEWQCQRLWDTLREVWEKIEPGALPEPEPEPVSHSGNTIYEDLEEGNAIRQDFDTYEDFEDYFLDTDPSKYL